MEKTAAARKTVEVANLMTVAVPDLMPGDVVLVHGCVFRITSGGPAINHPDSTVYAFATAYLGERADRSEPVPFDVFPMHWRQRWTVQGNRLASVTRVVLV